MNNQVMDEINSTKIHSLIEDISIKYDIRSGEYVYDEYLCECCYDCCCYDCDMCCYDCDTGMGQWGMGQNGEQWETDI